MPEIWLNYGMTEVVLDIRAENLEQKIKSNHNTLDDTIINEKLQGLDLTKPIELVIMHDSKSVRKIISSLFTICEQKSLTRPKILAEKSILKQIKSILPENSIEEFNMPELNSDLIFIGEVEFDGLFGYETTSTRLLRKYGQEYMLAAYSKRNSNVPAPGQITGSFSEATRFTDNFEIQCIDIVSNYSGIIDFAIGHPSKTTMIKTLESSAIKDVEKQKSMIISTGKAASNNNLSKSLSSLWNCSQGMKKDGLAILVAECQDGLGSNALQLYIEGRLNVEKLRNPSKYVDGMEDLLYLNEINNFQIGIISILPEFYIKNLNMIPLSGIKQAMDYIIKTQGNRQKVTVVYDGARLLLR